MRKKIYNTPVTEQTPLVVPCIMTSPIVPLPTPPATKPAPGKLF